MSDRAGLPLLQWGQANRLADIACRRRYRRRHLFASLCGTLALVAPALIRPAPRLLWNASASVPIGLYLITPGAPVARGDMAVAWLPDDARSLADRRHYLPRAVPLLKPVIATDGDRVCADGRVVTVNGHLAARRLRRDHLGRLLPWWQGCRTLSGGAVFLLGTLHVTSFDGRYFGSTAHAAVIGKGRPLWVW